jgi:hypothetical protein
MRTAIFGLFSDVCKCQMGRQVLGNAETGQVKIATSEVERLENVEPTNQDLEPNRDKFELLNET